MSQKHIVKMPGKKEPAKLSATLNNLLVIRLVIACVIFAVSLIIDIPDFLTTVLLVIAAGDVKVDNAKYKARFQAKARMLGRDEAADCVGHAVGGVCPFALKEGVDVYLDVLKNINSKKLTK